MHSCMCVHATLWGCVNDSTCLKISRHFCKPTLCTCSMIHVNRARVKSYYYYDFETLYSGGQISGYFVKEKKRQFHHHLPSCPSHPNLLACLPGDFYSNKRNTQQHQHTVDSWQNICFSCFMCAFPISHEEAVATTNERSSSPQPPKPCCSKILDF